MIETLRNCLFQTLNPQNQNSLTQAESTLQEVLLKPVFLPKSIPPPAPHYHPEPLGTPSSQTSRSGLSLSVYSTSLATH